MRKFDDFFKNGIFVSVLLSILLIFNLVLTEDFTFKLCFLLELFIIIAIVYKTILQENMIFDCSVAVFFTLFFYVAPIIQIHNNMLPNTMLVERNLVIRSILYTCLFLFTYLILRFYVKFPKIRINKMKNNKNKFLDMKYFGLTSIVLYIIFLIFLIPQLPKIMYQVFGQGQLNIVTSENLRLKSLITQSCIFLIPLFILSYNIYLYKTKSKYFSLKNTIFSFLLLILVKNFFIENRGSIGSVYLALIFYIFWEKLNTKKIMLILISAFIIAYPLLDQIVHSNINFNEITSGEIGILELLNIDYFGHFLKLDYDAWSNFMATIQYTKIYGFSYGKQILGSLFFFVPRYMWLSKPLATGEVIGRYLMSTTSMWFYALSNPIISEGYIDFGILGVIIYPAILVIVSKKIKQLIVSNSFRSFVGIYISVQMILSLRGDMLSSISYLIGGVIGVYYLPIIINRLILFILNKKV